MRSHLLLVRISFLAWVAVLALGVHFGRRVAPWFAGANSTYTLAGLLMVGGAGLAWAMVQIGPRPRAWTRMLPAAVGLALLGWSQPLMIERLHLLLYGVTGLLAWALFPARRGWRRGWPACGLAAAVGIMDELAQALHPERVGDWRDAATNAAAALLTICLVIVVESCRPTLPSLAGTSPNPPCQGQEA